MKKFLLPILLLFSMAACTKKEGGEDSCPQVDFSVAVENTQANLNIYQTAYTTYEVEYGISGFIKGNGTVKTISATRPVIENLDYGTYDVYLRAVCGNEKGAWSNAQVFVIDGSTSTCANPSILEAEFTSSVAELSWYASNDYFDVQYGPTGFKIGEGELIRTNNKYTTQAVLNANTTYDFYVRGNCGGSKYSKWAGPKSFHCPQNYNQGAGLCLMPSNLYAYKVNSMEINYSFNANGGVLFEYSFSSSSTSRGNILSGTQTSGTVAISSGSSSVSYFWVRAKCSDGSFTNWAKTAI